MQTVPPLWQESHTDQECSYRDAECHWSRKRGHNTLKACCGNVGNMLFVKMDTNFNWPEVVVMTTNTIAKTIAILRGMCSSKGIKCQIVSDNVSNLPWRN